MADDSMLNNVVAGRFGQINNKDSSKMLASLPDDVRDPVAQIRIPRKDMLRLTVHMILSIQKQMDENQSDATTGIMAWGWLTACEYMMSLAQEMPDIDYDERIETVRRQVVEARAIDSELIQTMEEMKGAIEQNCASYTDIIDDLNKMLRLITDIPGGN